MEANQMMAVQTGGGMALGICLGIAFGVAFGHIVLGMVLGMFVGMLFDGFNTRRDNA
jgi:hypothetical protein